MARITIDRFTENGVTTKYYEINPVTFGNIEFTDDLEALSALGITELRILRSGSEDSLVRVKFSDVLPKGITAFLEGGSSVKVGPSSEFRIRRGNSFWVEDFWSMRLSVQTSSEDES